MPRIVKGLFGGKSKSEKILQRFRPVGFQTGGTTASFDRGTSTFSVQRTAEGNTAIQNLISGFQAKAREFGGLRKQVTPGFGRLTRARVDAIRTAGKRAVGNLREELGKRRVLGSSFAQREIAGVEASFGEQEATARAESFLGELELNRQLIGEEFGAITEGAAVLVDQNNLDAALAANLSTATSNILNANLTAQAEARAAQEQAGEDFLGTVLGIAFGGVK